MAGIKRFITYVYAYETGTKGINTDLVKWRSGEMNAGLVHLPWNTNSDGMDQGIPF